MIAIIRLLTIPTINITSILRETTTLIIINYVILQLGSND
uniref:Uncharacterized protein n=1 Tax=Anguilla anguilla TaxID=7936 RepID=A0A0E9U0E7_ANGAN